ncbi:MAG: hypothetical protein ACPGU3_07830 [Litorivicinus sp.]
MKIKALLTAIAALTIGSAQAVEISDLRFSHGPERTRIVFDLSDKTTFDRTYYQQQFSIQLAGVDELPLTKVLRIDSPRLVVDRDPDPSRLTLKLATDRAPRVFTLPAEDGRPFRVVVDILDGDGPAQPTVAKVASSEKLKTEVAPKPALEAISDDQALTMFESDIDGIRDAVQAAKIEVADAGELTNRKRIALTHRVADSRGYDAPPAIHTAHGDSERIAKLASELVAQVKVQQPAPSPSPVLAQPKITQQPAPIVAKPKITRPTITQTPTIVSRPVIKPAMTQVSAVAVPHQQPNALARRIAVIEQAVQAGRIDRHQADEMIQRQRALFAERS